MMVETERQRLTHDVNESRTRICAAVFRYAGTTYLRMYARPFHEDGQERDVVGRGEGAADFGFLVHGVRL